MADLGLGYEETFRVGTGDGGRRSAETWARAVYEDAPGVVRRSLLLGWRAVLGLRLGPYPSPDHVLGWSIISTAGDTIRLEARSVLLTAELVLSVGPSTVTLTSRVHHHRWPARPVWTVLLPIHRRVTVLLLRRAASRSARGDRRPVVIGFQRHLLNPVLRRLAPVPPGQAVIETVGRRSGLARRTPVGGRRVGSSFWLVSEFGRRANYVRNIDADPRVRLQMRGRWYTGTAIVLDHDDPRRRLEYLPRVNGLVVRLVGTDLLTVRVDLDDPRRA